MADLFHLITPDIYPEVTKIRKQLIKLSPFFNSIVVYFYFVRNPRGELYTTILKCVPIIFLILYIFLKGFDKSNKYQYSRRIMAGLGFSVIGDALLNIDLLPYGMAFFAVTHVCYIAAFGWKPLKLYIAIPIHLAGIVLVCILFEHLDPVMAVGLPIYQVLLLTMCWRAIARAVHQVDFLSIFCSVGCISFVVSDTLIGIDMFLLKVPSARIWIMITYYFGQFAITVSSAFERTTDITPKKIRQPRPSLPGQPYLRYRINPKD